MSVAEWSLFYADLEYLEGLISAKWNRNPNEYLFTPKETNNIPLEIENQILKVNSHFKTSFDELKSKLVSFRININSNTFGQSKSGKERLQQAINHIQQYFNNIAIYCEVNYAGLLNIIQLHDRETLDEREKLSELFLPKLRDLQYYSIHLGHLLIIFSQCCSQARLLLSPSSSSSSLKKRRAKKETRRYLLKKEDIVQIKTEIAKHLPLYFSKKNNFKSSKRVPDDLDFSDYFSVSSTYFENEKHVPLYSTRLNDSEGVSNLRIRTFSRSTFHKNSLSQLPTRPEKMANPISVFMERNLKKNNFVLFDPLELDYHRLYDFCRGTFSADEYLEKIKVFSYSENELLQRVDLFSKLQSLIVTHQLSPLFSTQFDRTTFKDENDQSIKITVDSHIRFVKENGQFSQFWQIQNHFPPSDLSFDFPYAVLEISSSSLEKEEWLEKLKANKLLHPITNFSKFLHGCALFYPSSLPSLPHWLNNVDHLSNLDHSSLYLHDDHQNQIQVVESSLENDQLEARLLSAYEKSEFTEIVGKLELNKDRNRDLNAEIPLFVRLMGQLGFPIVPDNFIHNPKNIDPKTYLANERTLLKWVSLCILIQTAGIGYLKFIDLGYASIFTGACMIFFSLIFLAYAIIRFKYRNYLITYRQDSRFEDYYGPTALFSVMMVLLIVNGFFYLGEAVIEDQYAY